MDRCANGETVEFHAELNTVRTSPPSITVTLLAFVPYILAKGCKLLHSEVLEPRLRKRQVYNMCPRAVDESQCKVIVEHVETGMV